MAVREVRLPALTTTMEEAELVEWRVEVGDEVREGQPLGEVVTDKVDMELESPVDGTVAALLVEAGSVVSVGTVVARVDTESDDLLGGLGLDEGEGERTRAGGRGSDEGEDERTRAGGRGSDEGEGERTRAGGRGSDEGEDDAGDAGAAPSDAGTGNGRTRVPAPPPVRIRAREAGVDLADVTPTGRRGQVTTEDLRRYLEARDAAPPAAASAPEPPARSTATADGPAERRRAALRAATARVVTRSAAIPQFTLHRAIDLTRAVQRKDGRSWTTEIVRALAAALREHPRLNGRWNDEAQRVETIDAVRVGLAVDVPAGLLVVGVNEPDRITPTHADEHIREIVGRARDGRLDGSDVEGITFTVSNLGGLGVDAFDALLVPPQAGILSVGRVVERPVVVDGRIRPRLEVDVGLTVDHRVADGADGARLLETFAAYLEGA